MTTARTTEHGFASLFQMPGAGLGLVWLDGRAMKPDAGHGGHGAAAGAMSLRFGVYARDWKQSAEGPLDVRVCECCPTSAAVTADGPIVAFRNRSDEEVRDIHVTRFEAGKWTEPVAVHDDGWKIAGCPVNGPMLSARGRDVALAWFTGKDEQGRAFLSFSKDAGRTFGAPIRLDGGGTLGRVDVELHAGWGRGRELDRVRRRARGVCRQPGHTSRRQVPSADRIRAGRHARQRLSARRLAR